MKLFYNYQGAITPVMSQALPADLGLMQYSNGHLNTVPTEGTVTNSNATQYLESNTATTLDGWPRERTEAHGNIQPWFAARPKAQKPDLPFAEILAGGQEMSPINASPPEKWMTSQKKPGTGSEQAGTYRIFNSLPPALKPFGRGLDENALKGLCKLYQLLNGSAVTLMQRLSRIEKNNVKIIVQFLEAFERLSNITEARNITGLENRIISTFSNNTIDDGLMYGLAHEIIRIDGLIRSGTNITAIGTEIPDTAGRYIRYSGWTWNKEKGVLEYDKKLLADPIEADAYAAPKTLIEIKSMNFPKHEVGRRIIKLFAQMSRNETVETGNAPKDPEAASYALHTFNQILKLAAAVQEGVIDRIEFHITADPLEQIIIDIIQRNIPNAMIFRYDRLDTEAKERRLAPCSREFHWEPQVPGSPGRFRLVEGPPDSANGQSPIMDKSQANIEAFLPETSADNATITMRMRPGLTIGTIRNGKILNPSSVGLEIIFAAYIQYLLKGDAVKFNDETLRTEKRAIRIVQGPMGEEVLVSLEELAEIYGRLGGGEQGTQTAERIQDAADSLLRPFPKQLLEFLGFKDKLNINDRRFILTLCQCFGVGHVKKLMEELTRAERAFPGAIKFFFDMIGSPLCQPLENGEKWARELMGSMVTQRPNFGRIHKFARVLQLKNAGIELTGFGDDLLGIRGKKVSFQGWDREPLSETFAFVKKNLTRYVMGDAYAGPGKTLYMVKLLPYGVGSTTRHYMNLMRREGATHVRFLPENQKMVINAAEIINEAMKLRTLVQQGVIDNVEYHITGESLEPVMMDTIQYAIPMVKIFLYPGLNSGYDEKEEFPPNTEFHWAIAGPSELGRYKKIAGFADDDVVQEEAERAAAQAAARTDQRPKIKKAVIPVKKPQAPTPMDKFAALLHSSEAELVGLLVQAGLAHDLSHDASEAMNALSETPRAELRIHDGKLELDRQVCLILRDWKLYVVEDMVFIPVEKWLRVMKEHWMPHHNLDPERKIFITIIGKDKELTAELDSSAGLLIE